MPEEGEEEVVLRPKIRKDANNPFVMVPCRPQAPAQPNRLSRSDFFSSSVADPRCVILDPDPQYLTDKEFKYHI